MFVLDERKKTEEWKGLERYWTETLVICKRVRGNEGLGVPYRLVVSLGRESRGFTEH